jgi:hypothetical protein
MNRANSFRKPGKWLLSVAAELRRDAAAGAPEREALAMRAHAAALEVLARQRARHVAMAAAEGPARRAS